MALPNNNSGGGLPSNIRLPQQPSLPNQPGGARTPLDASRNAQGSLPPQQARNPVRTQPGGSQRGNIGQGDSAPSQARNERPRLPNSRPVLPSQTPGELPGPDNITKMASGYDYEGQAAKYSSNPYDEEDPFSTLSVDEQLEEDGDPFSENIDANFNIPVSRSRPNTSMPDLEMDEVVEKQFAAGSRKSEQQRNTNTRGRRVDKDKKDVFVNVEELKVEPFGGKQKIRVGAYDDRENRRKKATMIQWGILGVIGLILILALKNTLLPPATISSGEVSEIIAQDLEMTSFPLDRGRGFVEDFMGAYLVADPDSNAVSNAVLAYFYSGSVDGGTYDTGLSSNGVLQHILYGPTIYSETYTTDYSATYVVGAFVQQFVKAEDLAEGEVEDPAKVKNVFMNGKTYRASTVEDKWMFFAVDVFYDPATNSMSVAPDSPTLIPNYAVMATANTPIPATIGTGESSSELNESMTTIITEFLKAYRVSSSEDYSSIIQYVVKDPSIELRNGLNSKVDFNGSPESAISFEAYPSTVEGQYRVKATVNWISKAGDSDNYVSFTSTYFISAVKDAEGKYLVSDITSMPYIPNNEWIATAGEEQ